MHTFRVQINESPLPGRQITADVVRNDGRVVRSSMWPEYAEVDCALLNECQREGWSVARYFAERKARMAAIRN